jgi:hypothetical protein
MYTYSSFREVPMFKTVALAVTIAIPAFPAALFYLTLVA